jgi:hypothetical protein
MTLRLSVALNSFRRFLRRNSNNQSHPKIAALSGVLGIPSMRKLIG